MFDPDDPLQEFILANAARRRTDPDLSPAPADAVEPSWAVRKVGEASDFNATHPRLEGPPNAGWFATSVSDSTGERPAPSSKAAATLAQIDTDLKHP